MQTFESKYVEKFFFKILNYIPATLEILILSLIMALLVGSVIALIRLRNIPVLSQVARVFLSYARGTPVLTQLFIIYYGVPQLLLQIGIDVSRVPGYVFVVITYGFNIGAAVAENLRAAFASVDNGQREAGCTIGMTGFQTFWHIILPQAMVVAIPNFSNIVVASLKNTSLAFSVGVIEMMSHAKRLGASTNHFMESYLAVAVIYYVMYLVLSFAFKQLEKRTVRFINGG
jgi:L-cystine transport system permease protein